MNETTSPAPQFHAESGALRFWVAAEHGRYIRASISAQALHYRFQGALSGADAVEVYTAHRDVIDAAVRRRLASGSLEPVMLREFDVGAAPRL
jgi:hypothetical protein